MKNLETKYVKVLIKKINFSNLYLFLFFHTYFQTKRSLNLIKLLLNIKIVSALIFFDIIFFKLALSDE